MKNKKREGRLSAKQSLGLAVMRVHSVCTMNHPTHSSDIRVDQSVRPIPFDRKKYPAKTVEEMRKELSALGITDTDRHIAWDVEHANNT